MDDGGASAFKVYYVIRSFISFNGIFMAHGYDLGSDSIWRKSSRPFLMVCTVNPYTGHRSPWVDYETHERMMRGEDVDSAYW